MYQQVPFSSLLVFFYFSRYGRGAPATKAKALVRDADTRAGTDLTAAAVRIMIARDEYWHENNAHNKMFGVAHLNLVKTQFKKYIRRVPRTHIHKTAEKTFV